MHAYALTRLNVFALKGFIFHNNIHKKKNREGVRAIRVTKTKNLWWEINSRTRTCGVDVHKPNIRVKRWYNKYKILNYI